jgi:hypothetical protein
METQTMVTLGRNMPEEDLVHELAHQWFGSSVGPPPPVNGWLDSPTTPSSLCGHRRLHGAADDLRGCLDRDAASGHLTLQYYGGGQGV